LSAISTTAALPAHNAHALLEKIAMAFARLEELTPLSIMMRRQASERVYGWTLNLYKLAGET
jgi:hypothetical protein